MNEKEFLNGKHANKVAKHNKTYVLKKSFETLLSEAKKAGETKKLYVYLTLYKYAMCRDDFKSLMVVDTEKKAKLKHINYLVLPKDVGVKGLIILNVYKTSKKYGRTRLKYHPRQ